MKNLFVRFVKDNSGATAIEYGLIAAGISVAIIGVVWLVIEKTSFGATVKAGAHDSEIVRAPRGFSAGTTTAVV